MAENMVYVYDTNTGRKLARRVPEVWLRIFPHLSLTPKAKARPVPAPPKTDEEN
ncbi:TPA: hypothetical protein OQU49_004403 [Shigella flexneri]|nr:hypothetical protein [Shigella flexneri]